VNLSSFDFLNSSMSAGHTRLSLQPKLTGSKFMLRLSHPGEWGTLDPWRTESINASTYGDEARTHQMSSTDVEPTTAAAPALRSIDHEYVPRESAPTCSTS
jgi:hypothetical protein